MLPDEVRKAVEDIGFRLRCVWEPQADVHADFAVIRAHLLAREAEVERLRRMLGECYAMAGADTDGDPPERHAVDALAAVTQLRVDYDESCGWQDRAERAEALLREALPYCDTFPDLLRDGGDELRDRITAHLSENSRGDL